MFRSRTNGSTTFSSTFSLQCGSKIPLFLLNSLHLLISYECSSLLLSRLTTGLGKKRKKGFQRKVLVFKNEGTKRLWMNGILHSCQAMPCHATPRHNIILTKAWAWHCYHHFVFIFIPIFGWLDLTPSNSCTYGMVYNDSYYPVWPCPVMSLSILFLKRKL